MFYTVLQNCPKHISKHALCYKREQCVESNANKKHNTRHNQCFYPCTKSKFDNTCKTKDSKLSRDSKKKKCFFCARIFILCFFSPKKKKRIFRIKYLFKQQKLQRKKYKRVVIPLNNTKDIIITKKNFVKNNTCCKLCYSAGNHLYELYQSLICIVDHVCMI